MERQQIFNCVKEKLQEWGFSENEIIESAHLRNDLHLDSLDQIDLVMQCEKVCGGRVTDEVSEKCVTIGDVVTALYDASAQQV